MKFIMGEGWETMWDRFGYRGVIGLFYNDTLGGVLTYLVFGVIAIFAIIGLITVLKWLFFGRKKKDSEYHYFK